MTYMFKCISIPSTAWELQHTKVECSSNVHVFKMILAAFVGGHNSSTEVCMVNDIIAYMLSNSVLTMAGNKLVFQQYSYCFVCLALICPGIEPPHANNTIWHNRFE